MFSVSKMIAHQELVDEFAFNESEMDQDIASRYQ